MKAIRINDINPHTGDRAGGAIDIRDRNLFGNSTWQNWEACQEVRLIVNDDDTKYKGIPGVEVLHGEAAIDAAIADVVGEPKPRYMIQHEALMVEFIRQAGIDIRDLPPDRPEDWARLLYEKGCVGVRCKVHSIVKCKEIASGLQASKAGRRR